MPLIVQQKLSIDAEFNNLLHYKRSFEECRDLSLQLISCLFCDKSFFIKLFSFIFVLLSKGGID